MAAVAKLFVAEAATPGVAVQAHWYVLAATTVCMLTSHADMLCRLSCSVLPCACCGVEEALIAPAFWYAYACPHKAMSWGSWCHGRKVRM